MRIANNLLNVTDFNTNGLVKIYPNPAKDILNIEIDNYEDIMDLTMYSTTGKILLSKKTFNDQKLSIDVSNISEGLYFVRISSLTQSDTIKIIKK